MIPLQLQIKNFLSYGSDNQIIDFTPYHLICLSGKNGHGKSALLDAMTWAVWGQARKSSGQSKPDHGLLRLGQRNMRVVFDFEFNDQRYRVRREFTFAYGKPSTYLEFGMFVPNSDELVSLTDKTIRATQTKIEQLLGLDYDSFINSAFIRQGNAGEFSQKSPKERKEILGNILGLGLYDQLRKLAAEQARMIEAEHQVVLKLQERLSQDLLQSGEFQIQQQQLQLQIDDIQKQIKVLDQQRQVALQRQQELQVAYNQTMQWQLNLKQVDDKYQVGWQQLQQLRAKWRQLLSKLTLVIDRPELLKQQSQLIKKLDQARMNQSQFMTKREELVVSREQLHKQEQLLLIEHDQKILQIKLELEKQQLSILHYQKERQVSIQLQQQLQVEQRALEQELAINKKTNGMQLIEQNRFDRSKEFYQRFISVGNVAKQELIELHRKEQYLDADCPSCPLCEQSLSAARKRFLADQLVSQTQFASRRVDRIAQILNRLKAQIYDQHTNLDKINQKVLQQQSLQIKFDDLLVRQSGTKQKLYEQELQLQELLKQQAASSQLLLQLEQQRAKILTEDLNLQALRQKIADNQLFIQGYQVVDETVITQTLGQIQEQLTVQDQQELLDGRAQTLAQASELVQQLKILKIQKLDLQAKITTGNGALQELQIQLDLQTKLDQELQLYQQRYLRDTQQLGGVQARLQQFGQLQLELEQLQKKMHQLESQTQDYKSLVGAFGKDGIQALLIEEAIPEIEQEANQLLGRLTDYQSQLFIESLRDLKSGGTKETLDIKISDGAGLRPYEMFSGGEAFRIDFALRIAISKLLARRSGTALQTLIIDEGFGSQDEEGLSHIMDAIYKIQSDFAKIIIVSHLPSMKEQFPVHFQVQKTPVGSSISVVELG